MDSKLIELLACPTTRQPLRPLDRATLERVNGAIAAGSLRRGDGSPQTAAIEAMLVTTDGRIGYRVDDGIPVLLADESLDLAPLAPGA